MFHARHSVAMAIALLGITTSRPGGAQVPPRVSVLTCTNPASGATWRIGIDFDRATVDGNPARITDAAIAWRDAKDRGAYTLDRATGALTVAVPSSTGGYFLHDTCKPAP